MLKLLKLISTFLQVFTYEFNIISIFLQLFVLYFNIISTFLQFSVYNFNIISTILHFYNCRNYLISTDNFTYTLLLISNVALLLLIQMSFSIQNNCAMDKIFCKSTMNL